MTTIVPPDSPCSQAPCPTLLAAVRQFNASDYFICHETLEVLWMAEKRPVRDVYKGVLQIGIGLLHLQRSNEKGARILLTEGSRLLAPFLPVCLGLDLATLCDEAAHVLRRLDDVEQKRPLELGKRCPRLRLLRDSA
jgi:uncharacterized protein